MERVAYDTSSDLAPITLVATVPEMLVVATNVEAKNVSELIALAKAQPGKLNFASSGPGSLPHLAGELFKLTAKIDIVHVPYRGAAPALADVAGGQLPVLMCDLAASRRFIQGGKLRPLAVAHPTRLAELPGVPAFAELGMPRVEAAALMGLVVPASTPGEVVMRLQQSVASAIHAPAVQRKLAEFGVEPVGDAPAQFAALLQGESARWHPLIRDLNLILD
jgi:tripartite-type tricarboxylate transporter receptor subunit TctC